MNAAEKLRVLVADDHEGFRLELQRMLSREGDVKVVADESNDAEAVRRTRELRPDGLDLVLMDINMPIMNGIDATREIVASDPELPVIILTVSSEDEDLFAGVLSGAVGFLNKNVSGAKLIRTLRDFRSNGSLPMSRVMAAKAMHYLQQKQPQVEASLEALESLSSREREILTCVAGGAHDREIAASLIVAETTIKTHMRHILRKLGARNRAEAVARLRGRVSA